jgi:ubiquinone/menaquinone biosynthesis C-methylase UbiE
MKTPSQKQVWNNIAEEWHKFRDKEKNKDNPTQNAIFEFIGKQKGKILDLGSGTGVYLSKIKNGKMYLVDFSEKMLQFAKEKARQEKIPSEFFVSDVSNLPFQDNFFDAAIFISVLMCIEKEKSREKSVNELSRVLKPKSQAIINVWNKNSAWFKNSKKERSMRWRDKGARYYYLYDKEEVYSLFEKAGFKIVKKFKPDKSIMFIVEKS